MMSDGNGWLTVPFYVTAVDDPSILCFVASAATVYAGTSNNKVLQSNGGGDWTPFVNNSLIQDRRVSALGVWDSTLFIGSGSNGQIYVKDLKSGVFSLSTTLPDHSISAFVEHNGQWYAGTTPQGLIYHFNGTFWHQEFAAYGGVGAMISTGGQLFVFLENAETAVVYDGSSWSAILIRVAETPAELTKTGSAAISSGAQNHTVSSFRDEATEPVVDGLFINRSQVGSLPLAIANQDIGEQDAIALIPPNPETGIAAAVKVGTKVVFGGQKGVVFVYDGTSLTRLLNIQTPITAMVGTSDGNVLVAAKNKLFLVPVS